ncbi:MAG TPA: LLM class flavin-dependent oxidoreductase [Pyrinomonadaceae bacterium]|nr:LLM class flavin-dependent oxidoreductase [Pyrinomonadaceae bacterium]
MQDAAAVPLSVLDLAPVREGGTVAEAFGETVELARHVEALGFRRFWLAEHHSMEGIASAATAVLIGHVAGSTRAIRVGSGGVMLPNHSPLVVAEQFGTLATLYPGRIDLGLGRAPGADQRTARALRRTPADPDVEFPRDVTELLSYFAPPREGQAVRAVPGAGLDVPVWILGSSLFGARLAASLGLPFAFASHFAPDLLSRALDLYRAEFRPSPSLERPYVMLGLNACAAETDEEARRLFTSAEQQFVRLRRGRTGKLPPPVETMDDIWTPAERFGVERALACSVVGSEETVRRGLKRFAAETRADELMVVAQIYERAARLRSFELVARAARAGAAGANQVA